MLGLIPKVKNTITLTITDTDGNATTRTIEQTGPKLLGEEEVRLEQAVAPDESTVTTLGNGLYAILGNDSNEQDFMYYYDANGVIRGEIPVLYYRSHRLLFDNDGIMWFSASTKHFVGMNRLGKLVKIINLGDQYILHHDYALDSDGNIVSLATDLKHSDHAVQDQVIKVDTDSGEVSLLVDFGDLFPDYKQSTDHSGIDESDPTATNRWDWIHFNTIQLMDDGSALLSARETSTMIKINDIEGTPSLDYMIGEPSVWNGMDAQPSFLTKVGDSGDTGGQHSITVQYDSSLEDGQYYIYMFDNDFGYAMTRPDFDWTMIDGISTAQSSKDENSNSQFRKYLVDENAGTYTEVQDFDVPYSPYVSSAQELSDDLNLVDIGMQGLFASTMTTATSRHSTRWCSVRDASAASTSTASAASTSREPRHRTHGRCQSSNGRFLSATASQPHTCGESDPHKTPQPQPALRQTRPRARPAPVRGRWRIRAGGSYPCHAWQKSPACCS